MEGIGIRTVTSEEVKIGEAIGDKISVACSGEQVDRVLLGLTFFTAYVINETNNPDLIFKAFMVNLDKLIDR